MLKTINLDNLESKTDIEQSSDDELEIKPPKPEKEKIYKQHKERAPYVFTEKRKEAFEKAKEIREQRREERRLKKQEDEENKKQELENKIVKKAEVIKKKIAKKEKLLDIQPEDEESEPEIIIKKVKKPKKKIIYVESDSDEEVIHKRKPKSAPQPAPIKKYVPVFY